MSGHRPFARKRAAVDRSIANDPDAALSSTGPSTARIAPVPPSRVPAPRMTGRPPTSRRRARRHDGRLGVALLLSVLMHALLLQLSFGGQGLGRPAFGFPWGVPAIGMPELRLVFAPTKYLDGIHLEEHRIEFCQLPFEIYKTVKPKK